MRVRVSRSLVLMGLVAAMSPAAQASGTTKDIVLDRLTAPAAAATAAPGAASDAMAVSVLLESGDGTLIPRGTQHMFKTGDRFRVKVLASRDGKLAFYNTNPKGVLGKAPVWQGEVKVGQEVVSPRLRLQGNSGVDQLHILLEPAQAAAAHPGVVAWLSDWLSRLRGGSAKDIGLDVQDTATATYLLNARGQGLVTTVRIAHR